MRAAHVLRILLILPIALFSLAAAAVTQQEVVAGAERLYRQRLAEHEQRFELDADAAFLARVRRIASILIAQARRDYPETSTWNWEVHTTTSVDDNAFCMAGGKLLIGQAFVARLGLDDTELAMLLSHEMQHAILQHNRKEYEEALRIEPRFGTEPFSALEYAVDNDPALMSKLEEFNARQEDEADSEGLKLAWRAGWPPGKLANYFRKMMRASPYPNFDRDGYAAPSRRWEAARQLADKLEGIGESAMPK